MLVVAIGWQVYAIHRNPLDLGFVGLAEFVPLPILALPAGHLADRVERRLVVAGGLAVQVAIAAVLVVVTLSGAHKLWPFLAIAVAAGIASAVTNPAGRALTPEIVPPELLPGAVALRILPDAPERLMRFHFTSITSLLKSTGERRLLVTSRWRVTPATCTRGQM